MLMVSSLMFIQCTTDTIEGQAGADGLNGIDGVDGTNGANGLDGTDGLDGADIAVCISCHSDSHRETIYSSYSMSKHGNPTSLDYAGARSGCAECHSSEGYIDMQTNGFVDPNGYYSGGEPELSINDNDTPDDPSDDFVNVDKDYGLPIYTNNPVNNVTPISCNTCHNDHRSFDFANDGNDLALRNIDGVILYNDETEFIDFENTSNACISCHQARRTGPTDDGEGNFKVTSSHWGPHHGPQANLIEGIQGSEISGSEMYPPRASSTHRIDASCVSCHMGETTDGSDGEHSWVPTDNACLTCHSTVPSDQFLQGDMDTLAALLETVGIVHDGHPVPGTYTIAESEAAWNYLYVLEDASKGIHNPAYAKALINNSIEALQ